MKACRFVIGLALAQVLLAPATAWSMGWGSAGMVVTIRNARSDDDVQVERPGEGRQVIGPHDPLYNGDHLVIRGDATACVNVSGVRSCWSSRTRNTTVKSHGIDAASLRDAVFFRAIGLGPPAAGMGIASGTLLRSAEPMRLAAIGLLPEGTQFVTPATRKVVAGWRGRPRTLTITSGTAPAVSIPAPSQGFAEIPVPSAGADFRVQLDTSDVAWTVQTSPSAPTPPWYEGRQPSSPIERLARATWIVTDGPSQWRMFALGELADLTSEGCDGAAELYRAALEGRLELRH